MKSIIIDLDGTLTLDEPVDYANKRPNFLVVEKCREWKRLGYKIIIYTSRNMRTYDRNLGMINVHTLPAILAWLEKHNIPFDEVIVGKPWPGFEGFYVDDKAIRPSEFALLSPDEIFDILKKENKYQDGGNK